MPYLDVVPLRRVPWGLREFTYDVADTGAAVGDLVWCRFGGHRTAAVAWARRPQPPDGVRVQPLLGVARAGWSTAPQRKLLDWASAHYATPLPTMLYRYGVVPPQRAKAAAAPEPGRLPEANVASAAQVFEADPGSLPEVAARLASAMSAAGPVLVLCPTRRDVQVLAHLFGAAAYDLESSRTERAATWAAVLSGTCRLVAGTAAAAFLPFPRLGGVVVYREGDPAAKAVEARPLLHLRTLGLALAEAYGCRTCVVDWAPSPAAAAWAGAGSGLARVGEASYTQSLTVATPPLLRSPAFLSQVGRASRSQRVLVVVPRLGEGGMVRCADCGYVPTCPACERSMPPADTRTLRCRYCGRVDQVPASCPRCHGTRLLARQPTVATVARQLRAANPDVGELSAESATDGGAAVLCSSTAALYRLDLAAFSQRVVLDFDTLTSQPSLESSHRAYRLVRELAWSGPTTVETRQPDHPSISLLGSWGKFVTQELKQRARYSLPPISPLVKLSYDGPTRDDAERAGGRLVHQLQRSNVKVAGSYAAPGRSQRRRYRWVVLVPGLEPPAGVDYSQWTADPDPTDLD